jgi:4-amino-4-deoxychorismate lyase/para-aminobenzoate synthetase/4-amino-4-deoxychorismate lyase
LSRGILPGVFRQRLIDAGDAIEADIATLPVEFYIGNNVRGLIRARLREGV